MERGCPEHLAIQERDYFERTPTNGTRLPEPLGVRRGKVAPGVTSIEGRTVQLQDNTERLLNPHSRARRPVQPSLNFGEFKKAIDSSAHPFTSSGIGGDRSTAVLLSR